MAGPKKTVKNPRYENGSILWDDAAFVRRAINLAEARGLSVRDTCKAAGISPDYLSHSASRGGRSIEALLRLAQVLNVGLGELTGAASGSEDAPIPEDAVKRLALVADIAAHLYVALSTRGVVPPRSERLVGEILQMVGKAA